MTLDLGPVKLDYHKSRWSVLLTLRLGRLEAKFDYIRKSRP